MAKVCLRGGLRAAAVIFLASFSVQAAVPTVNGSVNPVAEGYIHLTEAGFAAPLPGGQTTKSDFAGETASYNWWDGINNVNVPANDNRGDVIDVFMNYDAQRLYLAVRGPTALFNSWGDNPGASNDIGDLFLAIDAGGGAAAGSLRADQSHNSFGGPKAVDFNGWRPTHVVGMQYVDNGGGGGGFANLMSTGLSPSMIAGESQSLANGMFDWAAAVNASAGYDIINGNAGEYEIAIPWSMLGLSGAPNAANPLRIAAYTTQNFGQADVYDSAPGWGNSFAFEEIGDCPGDPDTGGQLGACDPGSFVGSLPGSNFVANLNFNPGRLDGIDTIEEYFQVSIPEPATLLLAALGVAAIRARRRG